MPYIDRKALPEVHDFANLSEGDQQKVIDTERSNGFGAAVNILKDLSGYPDGTKVYQMPQPAYATVRAVREQIGADVAADLETLLAGEPSNFHDQPIETKVAVLEIASAYGLKIP